MSSAKQARIEPAAMSRLISQAKAMGNSFFGILGGEPFMHPEILEILGNHRDCYFQVFTNGHFITDDVARKLREFGNVTPLVSVEGNEIVSDERRGKEGVLSKTMEGLANCLKHKVMTGVCTSLCQTNFDLLSEKWLDRLIDMGVMYTWFHIYRPVGPDAKPELALTPEQQLQCRKFVVEMRAKKPIIIIDAYYDGEGRALCPAATGFTHHISPWGDIEPCPIIQFAKESIYDERPLAEVFQQSAFLRDFRETAAQHTRGCIVLERPDLLEQLVDRHGAQTRPPAMPPGANWTRWKSAPASTTPARKSPRSRWPTASPSISSSTTTARTASTLTPRNGSTRATTRRRSGSWSKSGELRLVDFEAVEGLLRCRFCR